MKEMKVNMIENGTVIDHIPAGKATKVLDLLKASGEITLIAMNVGSSKMGKKDVLKMENKFLSPDEMKKVAAIAPTATINTIKNFNIVEKKKIK